MPIGKELHEQKLVEFKRDLEKEGWRVILLEGKSPDGIAVRDGKICAIEVLGKRLTGTGKYKGKYKTEGKVRYSWRLEGGFTFAAKRRIYSMFDDILFCVYKKIWTDTREKTLDVPIE